MTYIGYVLMFHGVKKNLSDVMFLGFHGSVDKCTSPLVKHLPTHVDYPCMQSETTPRLGLYELVNECSSPPVEHLPHVTVNYLIIPIFTSGLKDGVKMLVWFFNRPGVARAVLQTPL